MHTLTTLILGPGTDRKNTNAKWNKLIEDDDDPFKDLKHKFYEIIFKHPLKMCIILSCCAINKHKQSTKLVPHTKLFLQLQWFAGPKT